ncbi:alpha/beta fold hydrolase [Hydrogenophaga sp. UC242_53]|uniref:alpha/beta fold hydrolase n=1 Tax=Hydrogenophaga sp. UC242_53 TaxID=3350170 RepID=UPI0036D2FFE0
MHWIRNVEALSAAHELWVPDMPGFGESGALPPEVPRAARLEALVVHLTAALDALLGPEARFGLAGFSFGSLVAHGRGRAHRAGPAPGAGGASGPWVRAPARDQARGLAPGGRRGAHPRPALAQSGRTHDRPGQRHRRDGPGHPRARLQGRALSEPALLAVGAPAHRSGGLRCAGARRLGTGGRDRPGRARGIDPGPGHGRTALGRGGRGGPLGAIPAAR